MKNNFDIIRDLKKEIKESYTKLESLIKNNKEVHDVLLKLKQVLIDIENESINNLFDGNTNISEEETIKN